MDYEELFAKYQVLLRENSSLKSEIIRLKAQLGIVEQQIVIFGESPKNDTASAVSKNSESKEKIELFMSVIMYRASSNYFYALRTRPLSG